MVAALAVAMAARALEQTATTTLWRRTAGVARAPAQRGLREYAGSLREARGGPWRWGETVGGEEEEGPTATRLHDDESTKTT